MSAHHALKVGIFGAGSIGCHLAARLAATGTAVHLLGRPRIGDAIRKHGLSASDHLGQRWEAAGENLSFDATVTPAFLNCDVILVCVKSAATPEAGQALAGLPKGCLVVSLQNGVRNAQQLEQALPQCSVLTGMVPFNVVNQGNAHFHQGSEGSLDIQDAQQLDAIEAEFAKAQLPWRRHPDMLAVQWSKLVLNLNNPINALSGLPLRTELSQRAYRQCLALAQTEALSLMDRAAIPTAKIIALPTALIPRALNVPDWLFARLGSKMLAIDPQARSSMWEDLELGRKTEIDWLNGEVLRLAEQLKCHAPVNAKLVELIRAAESGGRRDWSGAELLAQLKQQKT